MKKKRGFFQKGRGKILVLAALISMGSCFPAKVERVQAVSTPAAISAKEVESEWKEARQSVEEMQEQLMLYQEAMEELKGILAIYNTGSLESQLEEILIEVKQKISYTQDLKDEIERQVTVDFLEVDTEGISQTQAIFTKIGQLRLYARDLDRFYKGIQNLLGLEAASTDQEIYQAISNLKDQVAAYHLFLDQAEELIQPDGVNGSQSLLTGEQTREELRLVYAKMEEMKGQLDFLKELLPILLEGKEISIENQEAQKALLEEVIRQKKEAEDWMNQIRTWLELASDAGQAEIADRILEMKTTLAEYGAYLGEVEVLLSIEDGSSAVTGSALVLGDAVRLRLKKNYEALTDLVEQHKKMEEIIQELQEKEELYQEKEGLYQKQAEELKELKEELERQKVQSNRMLSRIKTLLGLKQEDGEEAIIETILQMKATLSEYWAYLGEAETLLQMPDGSGLDLSEIVDGEAVTVRLTNLHKKLLELVEQQEQMKETIVILQEKEDLSAKQIQELTELLEEMKKQKEEADQFLKELRNVLGLGDQADYLEVMDTITGLKEQLEHSFQLVLEFMKQIGMDTGEEEGTALTKQLEMMLEQVWVWMEQLETEVKKTEQAEKKIVEFEQEIRILTIEKQQSVLEIEQLKQEIAQLKQNSSLEEIENLKREQKELEQENQRQKEQIAELQKKLQVCAEGKEELREEKNQLFEEKEELRKEKNQLFEKVIEREKEGKEYQEQIELIRKELAEKERKMEEMEAIQKRQKPMQDLLEQNQISYEQLLLMISKLKEESVPTESEETIPVIKSEEDTEEELEEKEEEEMFVRIPQESESRKPVLQESVPQEIISKEIETTELKVEETTSDQEEQVVVTEDCSCGTEGCWMNSGECVCGSRECQINLEDCFCGVKECERNPEDCFCGIYECPYECQMDFEEGVCGRKDGQGNENGEEGIFEEKDSQIKKEEGTGTAEEIEENNEELSGEEEGSFINNEEEGMTKEEEKEEEQMTVQEEEEQKNGHFGMAFIFILLLLILIGTGVLARKNRRGKKE